MSWHEVATYLSSRAHWSLPEVGRSSDAMIHYAINGGWPSPDEFPHDASDLNRCRMTYERAPRTLRRRMERVLDVYERAHRMQAGL